MIRAENDKRDRSKTRQEHCNIALRRRIRELYAEGMRENGELGVQLGVEGYDSRFDLAAMAVAMQDDHTRDIPVKHDPDRRRSFDFQDAPDLNTMSPEDVVYLHELLEKLEGLGRSKRKIALIKEALATLEWAG
ncbi:MAG: hypothetical protein A3B31_02165 [Candidatus Komeilibacteria bacterium RIFCSPLOWO2_01_FULL_53_11]|uniref:Uncharacterized protein n=1 Tax=Candidatus Komeilibacteria bacterium RIFCSPLOWO2_01_FULL_53_11 TaxID=1798552 RepID=A0A1G2BV75_9BACT|nr:MAG: hypothetical protein A3B31_02165 [Candidatus Komeilibacteria bacterium RIFCSPLOWO2_01_FULL_53_11]